MLAYDYQLLLKHLLEHGVAWAPGQEIVYRDQMRYTYTDMYKRVLLLASALQRLGVGEGTKVGVIEWDSHRYLEIYFGIPGIGAVLHTINPRLSLENLIYTMAHAEDEVLIFHEDFLPLVEQIRPRLPTIRKYILITDQECSLSPQPPSRELDPGNGVMKLQSKKIRSWLGKEFGIGARSLPYQIEYGGAFLKDSAHLAGLGVIGRNNLLVTPEFGTRIRLRGMFIEADLEPTGPMVDFDPCHGCDMPCHKDCPRDAFRSGSFERAYCKEENDERYANEEMLDGSIMGIEEASMVMKPCRYCELACPIAQEVSQ